MKATKSRLALAIMAATASLVQAGIVLAEESQKINENQPTLMGQITVTASRIEKQLKDVAGSVAVIDDEQIENELARNIQDLVRYEPGVSVGSNGRTGAEGFNIRGMEGNRVKVMVDGVDQPQQFDSGFTYQRSQRNFIDIDTLKSVEIVKGPSSSLYGSDAIGGIVAYQTKDPSDYLASTGDDTAASVKASYTSVDEGFSETFTLANRTGQLESLLVYTRRDYNETETFEGADVTGSGRGKADPVDAGSDNLLGKLQYQINDNHRVGLTAEYLNSKSEIELKSGEDVLPSETTGKDKLRRSRVGIFHEWDAGLAFFDSMEWQLDWQDSETVQKTYVPAYGRYNDRVKDYAYGEESLKLSIQFNKSLKLAGLNHSLVYGVDLQKVETRNDNATYESGKSAKDETYIPKVTNLTYGLFIQDDIQLSKNLTLIPGLRYDSYDYSPDGNNNQGTEASDSKGDKLTARLGAVYDLNDSYSLFGQFSQGFKAPGLYEMYYYRDGGFYMQQANPDLKPEESDSIEIGLRGEKSIGSFEITGFFNRYDNFIDTRSDYSNPAYPYGITQYQNVDRAEIKGVEFRGQLWLDEALNTPVGTSLRASVAYADGENREDGEALNSVAPLTGVIGLSYDDLSGNWGGEVLWTLVKGKDDSDVSNSDVNSGETQFNPGGYGLVDLTAYYSPVDDITLRAGLFNIADKKYYSQTDVRGRADNYAGLDRYSQPGRNFSVSVKWDI